MDQCASCGAALAGSAQWCGQCYAPTTAAPSGSAPFQRVGVLPPQSLPAPVVRSRWRKTQTTFGPAGRVIATVCLIVPFLFMLITGVLADPFVLGGAAVWGFVIMPWGLRDVWKAGQVLPG